MEVTGSRLGSVALVALATELQLKLDAMRPVLDESYELAREKSLKLHLALARIGYRVNADVLCAEDQRLQEEFRQPIAGISSQKGELESPPMFDLRCEKVSGTVNAITPSYAGPYRDLERSRNAGFIAPARSAKVIHEPFIRGSREKHRDHEIRLSAGFSSTTDRNHSPTRDSVEVEHHQGNLIVQHKPQEGLAPTTLSGSFFGLISHPPLQFNPAAMTWSAEHAVSDAQLTGPPLSIDTLTLRFGSNSASGTIE
ncbi:hypothetical protein BKA63DRAFT_493602 [Paraphoma chrysanthemicola]|nr:hypothetical protein BKA63DRAFT_493602 [Paraphoma chrysanthemicola]